MNEEIESGAINLAEKCETWSLFRGRKRTENGFVFRSILSRVLMYGGSGPR